METKELTVEEIQKQAMESVKNIASETAEKHAKELIDKWVSEKNAESDGKFTTKEEAENARKEFEKSLSNLSAEVKKAAQIKRNDTVLKSFEEIIKETILENKEVIENFKTNGGEKRMTMKSVADMSLPTHTDAGFRNFIQDRRENLITTPHNRVWLSDLLPSGTSTGNSVVFPKENGGEGGVAVWGGSGNKAQVDYDFTSQSAFFKWIAGWVVVEREMLDDVNWLSSYLAQKLYVSLKLSENNFILNGTSDTNPVIGLIPTTANYDGSYSIPSDVIIDAVYGQIPEDTHDWYMGNNVLLSPRTQVKVGLRKADGSGEYDLPSGSISFDNGSLKVGGVKVTPTTGIDNDKFLAFDRNAVMFLRRMQPELRMFEDATLAKTNKVMFRIEERVTQVIFNSDAIVYGDINGTTAP